MAHGLLLRMQEMIEHKSGELNLGMKINGNLTETPDVRIIKSWIGAVTHPHDSKMEFYTLLRQTLLLILSPQWIKSNTQKDLLYAFKHHNRRFSSIVRNCTDIYNCVLQISIDPWQNTYFEWDDLFDGKLTIEDKCVQDYFYSEPEEVVLARVNFLALSSEFHYKALTLAKQLFLYHYRITKYAVFYSKPALRERNRFIKERSRRGHASIDWIALLLQKIKSLPQIMNELQQLTCHEGIEIIGRMRENPNNKRFSYDVIQILLVQDLTNPSQYCCTKKLFVLFCIMHKEQNSGPKEIAVSAVKILARFAPSSAHFYLFVDAAYEEFGTRCIDLYVDLYVRGLTADLNHLEIKKQAGATDDVNNLETHIATTFAKLSSLFINLHEEAARECMFSAFSLRPSKERLLELQRLTQSLSNTNKAQLNFTSSSSSLFPVKDCTHGLKCDGSCNATTNNSIDLAHPLLNKGIRNISYNVIKDFVSLLESARCITFQYNVFDWRRTFSDLSDYLIAFNVKKPVLRDWGSDTEVGSDGSMKSDSEESESKFEGNASKLVVKKVVPPIKRKSDSDISQEICPLDVGANIEVGSNDISHKRIKLQKSNLDGNPSVMSELSKPSEDPLHSAIEKVIRKTLNDKIPKGQSVIYSVPTKYGQLNNSAQSSITPGICKGPSENLAAYAHAKQINSVQEHCHPLTSGSKNTLPNHKPKVSIENSYFSQVASVPLVSKHNVVRQSVVVTPVSNSSAKQTDFSQQQEPPKLSYPVQKSIVKTVNFPVQKVWKDSNFKSTEASKSELNRNNQGALNLSSGRSNSGKNKHFQSYLSKASVFAPEPVATSSSPFIYDSAYTPHPKKQNHVIPFDQKMQISCDRNSVIQHTMQHISQKTSALSNQLAVSVDSSTLQHVKERSSPILNQLSVSADSSAMQHVRNNSRKDGSALSPFQINISNAMVSKPNLPVPAVSVMSHKPSLAGISTQSILNDKSSLNRCNTATLSRKLPPSVSSIVVPSWGKNYLLQTATTKITNASNTSSVQKSYPKPYKKPLGVTSQLQAQLLKHGCAIEPSKVTIPLIKPAQLVNKNFTPSSQQWASASDVSSSINNQHLKTTSSPTNNSQWSLSSSQYDLTFRTKNTFSHSLQPSSSPTIPLSVSSQSWYSSPYPKNIISSHVTKPNFVSSVKPTETSGVMQKFNQDTWTVDHGLKYAIVEAPLHSLNDNLTQQTSSEKFLFKPRPTSVNSFTSGSNAKMNLSFKDVKVSAFENKAYGPSRQLSEMPTDLSSAPSSSVTSSISNSRLICDRLAKSSPHHYNSNSCDDSVLVRDDKGVVVFRAANAVPASQYSHAQGGGNFVKTCCSPLEVQPCESCSSLSESKTYPTPIQLEVQESNSSQAINLSNQVPKNHLPDYTEKNQSSRAPIASDSDEDSVIACKFCSFEYPVSLMMKHMEMSHHNELKEKEYSFTKNDSVEKTSLIVYSHSNLQNPSTSAKHDPGGGNACTTGEDDESLLNLCYNLFSNQQNLSKLVNNASSLDQMDNSLPLIQYNEAPLNINEMARNVANTLLSNLRSISKDGVMKNTTTESAYPNLASYVRNAENTEKSDLLSNFGKNCKDVLAYNSANNLSSYNSMSDSEATKELKVLNFMNSSNLQFPISSESSDSDPNHVDMKLSSSSCTDISPRADMYQSEGNFFNCGICKEKLQSHTALQKHIADCFKKFADEEFKSSSPDHEMKPMTFDESDRDAYNESMFDSISKTSEDSRKDNLAHPSEVFDFDPRGSDNVVQETYRPVQKGKLKLNVNQTNLTPSEQKLKGNSKASCKKIKKELKTPSKPCQYCGKMLTVLYMKQHFLKKHRDKYLAMNSQQSANLSSAHENKVFPSVSNLLEEDIDSNACLSPSDALNSKVGIDVTDHLKKLPGCNNGDRVSPIKENEIQVSLKSKLKLKIFSKSDSFASKAGENSRTESGISDLTLKDSQESYKCHICLRTLTTEFFLRKHLKNLHDFHGPLPENESDYQQDDKPVSSLQSFGNVKPEIDKEEKYLLKTSVEFIQRAPCKPSSSIEENSQHRSGQMGFANNDIYGALELMQSDGSSNLDPSTESALVVSSSDKSQKMEGNLNLASENNTSKTNGIVRKCIEKKFKCHLCRKAFAYNRNLVKHIETYHSSQSPASGKCPGDELVSKSSLIHLENNYSTIHNVNKPDEIKLLHLTESYSKEAQPGIKSISSSGCGSYSTVSKDKFTASVANQMISSQVSPINLSHQNMPIFVDNESNPRSDLEIFIKSENELISNEETEIIDYVCRFCWLKHSNERDLDRHYEEKHSFNSTLVNFKPSPHKFTQIFNASGTADENINTSKNAILPSELPNNFNRSKNVPSTSYSNNVFENCTDKTNFVTIKNEAAYPEISSMQNNGLHEFKRPYQQEHYGSKFQLSHQNECSTYPKELPLEEKNEVASASEYSETANVINQNSAIVDKNGNIIKKVYISKRDYKCDLCLKTLSTQGNLVRHKKAVHSKKNSDKSTIQKSVSPKLTQFSALIHPGNKFVEQKRVTENAKLLPNSDKCAPFVSNPDIFFDEHFKIPDYVTPPVDQIISTNEGKSAEIFNKLLSELFTATEERDESLRTFSNALTFDVADEIECTIPRAMDESYKANNIYEMKPKQVKVISNMNVELPNQPTIESLVTSKFESPLIIQGNSANNQMTEQLQLSHNVNSYCGELEKNEKEFSKQSFIGDIKNCYQAPSDAAKSDTLKGIGHNDYEVKLCLAIDNLDKSIQSSNTLSPPVARPRKDEADNERESEIAEQIAFYCRPNNECGICLKSYSSKYALQVHIRRIHIRRIHRKDSTRNNSAEKKTKLKNSVRSLKKVNTSDSSGTNFCQESKRKVECPVCQKVMTKNSLLRHLRKLHGNDIDINKYKTKTVSSNACQPSVHCQDDIKKFDELVLKYEQDYSPQTKHISVHSESSSNAHSWALIPQENDSKQQNGHSINLTENPVNSLIGNNKGGGVFSQDVPSSQRRHKNVSQSISTVPAGESFSSLHTLEVLDSEEKSMPHLVPECKFPVENESRQLDNSKNRAQSLKNSEINPTFEANNGNMNAKQCKNQSQMNECFQVIRSFPDSTGNISRRLSADNFDVPSVEFHFTTIEPALKLPGDSSPLIPLLIGDASIEDKSKNFFETIDEPCNKTTTSPTSAFHSKIKQENSYPLDLLSSDTSMQETSVKMSSNLFYDVKPHANALLSRSSSDLNQAISSKKDGCAHENLGEKEIDLNECFDTSSLSTDFSQTAIKLTPKSIKALDCNSNLSNQQLLTPATMSLVIDSNDGFLNNLGEQKHVYSYNHNFVLSVLQDLGVSRDSKTECDQITLPESVMKSTDSHVNEKIKPLSAMFNISSNKIHLNDSENQKNPDLNETLDPLYKCSPNLLYDSNLKENSISVGPSGILGEVQQTLAACLDKVCKNEDLFSSICVRSNSTVSIDAKIQGSTCHRPFSAKSKTASTTNSKNKRKWSSLKARCNQTMSMTGKDKSVIKKSLKTSYSVLQRSKSNRCQLCQKGFKSMTSLSKHLKDVHSVPVLKKQISSSRVKCCPDDNKLSPPNLSLISTYDSESAISVSIIPSIICGSISTNSSVREVVDDVTQLDQSRSFDCRPSENKSFIENSPTTETTQSDTSHKISLKLKTLCKPSYLKKRSLCRITKTKSRPTSSSVKEIMDEGVQLDSIECKPSNQFYPHENSSAIQATQSNLSFEVPSKLKTVDEPSFPRKHSMIQVADSAPRNSNPPISTSRIEPVCNSIVNTSVSNKNTIDKGSNMALVESIASNESSLELDQNSINQKSALPKCIIKVCKDDQNSVFYQIDNSQKKSDITQLSVSMPLKNNFDKPMLRKRSFGELNDDCIILSSDSELSDDRESKRRVKRCFRSNFSKFPNSVNCALNFKSRLSKSQFNKKTTVKSKQTTNLSARKCTKAVRQTFKESINIKQFLKEHKQPVVQLMRIENMHVHDLEKVVHKAAFSSSLQHNSKSTKKPVEPVVVLERINFKTVTTNNFGKIHLNTVADSSSPQKSSDICSKNAICFKKKKMYKSPVKSSDGITSEKVTLREKSNVTVDIHTSPNDVGLKGEGSKKPDSQDPKYCAPGDEENCVLLPSIKECSVVLKKLPV